MITVTVAINGHVIYARSAANRGEVDPSDPDFCIYEVDNGTALKHNRKDGAVALAAQMLKTIKAV